MALCWACGDGRVIVDPASGAQVCDSCGTEHASDDFRHESFTADGRPVGHLINSVGEFGDKERKIRDAKAVVSELTARLGLSGSRASEAESMVSDVTDGAFGTGVWFPVLVGACSYLVMRRHSLPLPLAEVADAVGCDVPEVGRMVSRVVRQLDLEPLPEFDAVQSLERAVRYCPSLSGLGTEKTEELIGQGRFLLHCAIKWFLMTGRQPLPMIAAVVAFVANVNGVVVGVEEIAREIYANVSTSQRRLKELSNTLIRVARALLPWGEDVTVKNLAQNAPVLIRIMEMKSKSRINSEGSEDMGFNLNDFVEANSNPGEEEEDSKYYKVGDKDGALNMSEDELERLKLSGKLLSHAYKNVLARLGQIKERGELGKDLGKKRKRRRGFDFDAVKDSWQWEGRWEADKGLKLKQVLQKDVGYEALPPSFVAGVEARRKRRMRIEDARHRISEVMKPPSKSDSNAKEKPSILKSLVGRKRRRGVGEDMVDWEDCIIELLLLHGVHENEIEQGQYKRLNIKLEGICKAWRMLLTHFYNQILPHEVLRGCCTPSARSHT